MTETLRLPIVNKSNHPLPEYATNGSAAMDLRASLTDENIEVIHKTGIRTFIINGKRHIELYPGERVLIPTDLFVAVPEGYVLDMRARSGLALKHGISLTNGTGVIDSDYRGNVGVLIINNGNQPFQIQDGDRIAQAILLKHETISWNQVDELPKTERGEGGFGHTGK